jgi:hypothetical protein
MGDPKGYIAKLLAKDETEVRSTLNSKLVESLDAQIGDGVSYLIGTKKIDPGSCYQLFLNHYHLSELPISKDRVYLYADFLNSLHTYASQVEKLVVLFPTEVWDIFGTWFSTMP